MGTGLWTSPNEYRAFSAADRSGSLSREIATRDGSIDFYSVGMYLLNPDPILRNMGKQITAYRDLLADAHLQGCVSSRKAGVKRMLWDIDRGKAKSRQARFVKDCLSNLDLSRIFSDMLNAPLFGNQPMEILWDAGATAISPRDVVAKPQQWFVWDENNEPRFLTKTNTLLGEQLPARKFLFPRNEPSYENPYGFALLSCCFWPVTFKKGGMKFWVTFTEKFGMPHVVVKHRRGEDQTEIDRMADMAERMVQDAIAVIPEDGSVEILENKGTASADLYDKLRSAMNSEVSIALLGQNLTTEVKGGSLAAASAHMQVRDDIVADDQSIVELEMNRLIRWIVELNFAERADMPLFYLYNEEDVDKTLAERDEILTKTGLRFRKAHYVTAYGLSEDEFDVGQPPDSSPTAGQTGARATAQDTAYAFSAPGTGQKKQYEDQAAIDGAVDALDPAALQRQMEQLIAPVVKMVRDGADYHEIMAQLAGMYPAMDSTALEEALARALFVSEVMGRLNATARVPAASEFSASVAAMQSTMSAATDAVLSAAARPIDIRIEQKPQDVHVHMPAADRRIIKLRDGAGNIIREAEIG